MHATYLFLMCGIEDGPEALNEATSYFESRYCEHYCDENNWWRTIGLSVEDGGSYPNRDEGATDTPSFEEAWHLSGQIAFSELATYMDLGVNPFSVGARGDRERDVEKMEPRELVEEGVVLAGAELARQYTELSNRHALTPAGVGGPNQQADLIDLDGWKRRRLGQCIEHMSRGEHRPFSYELATPYEWRLFDLTDGEREKVFSILSVDIHT